MATVTSKNKAEFDRKEMAKRAGEKDTRSQGAKDFDLMMSKAKNSQRVSKALEEDKPKTYAHPQKGGGDITAYPVGASVMTDTGEKGYVSHTAYGHDVYPHSYKVASESDKTKHLEHGNHISHTRLKHLED
jgi:hypothetical protein